MSDPTDMDDPFDFNEDEVEDEAPEAAPVEAPAEAEAPPEKPEPQALDPEVQRKLQEHEEFKRWWQSSGSQYEQWLKQQAQPKAEPPPAEEPEEDIYDQLVKVPTTVAELRAQVATLQQREQERVYQQTLLDMQRELADVESKYDLSDQDKITILDLHERYGFQKSMADCAKMIRATPKGAATAPQAPTPPVVPAQGARRPTTPADAGRAEKAELISRMRNARDPFDEI